MNFILSISPLFPLLAVNVQRPFSVGLVLLFGATAGVRIFKYRALVRKDLQIEFALFLIMSLVILVRVLLEYRITGDLSGPTVVLFLGFCSFYIALYRTQDWLNSFVLSFTTLMALLCLIGFFQGSLGSSRSGMVFEIPANLFGVYCALSSSLAFHTLLINKKLTVLRSTFFVFSFLICSIGVLHTSSYGALVAYVSTLLMFQMFQLGRYKRLLSLASVLGILALSFSNITFDPLKNTEKVTAVSESIVTQTNNLSSITDSGRPLITPRSDTISSSITDRQLIAEKSMKSIYSQSTLGLLFGAGSLKAETNLVLPSTGSAAKFVPHNAFISFTKSYGVVSIVCFLTIIIKSLVKSRRDRRFWNIVPFTPVWLSSFFMDLQWSYLFMLFLVSLASLRNMDSWQPHFFRRSKVL